MYIYLQSVPYGGTYVLDVVNDEQAIAEWRDYGERVPESTRLRRVHNTGTEIVREEYQYPTETWVRIDWAGNVIREA
jgi:hypothetical protein